MIHDYGHKTTEQPALTSFRDASSKLFSARSDFERIEALQALSADPALRFAAWECVKSFLERNSLSQPAHNSFSPDIRSLITKVLSQGSDSQRDQVAQELRDATIPLVPEFTLVAEVVMARAECRTEWFRELLSADPALRLRASEVITWAPPHALSSKESMAMARYLFSSSAEDQGAIMLEKDPRATPRYSDTAGRIQLFFSRHASRSSLSVAELAMARNQIYAHLGTRMLVEHGEALHREVACDHIIKQDHLAQLPFDQWPPEALGPVEAKLVDVLEKGEACSLIKLSIVRALKKLRPEQSHERPMLALVERESWNTELARVVGDYLVDGRIPLGAVEYALDKMGVESGGLMQALGIKQLSKYFFVARPSCGQVELAARVLDASGHPDREGLYAAALKRWDLSGRWLVGESRLVVARRLAPGSAAAEREFLHSGNFALESITRRDGEALLAFAAGSSVDVASRIIRATLRHSQLNPHAVEVVASTLEKLWDRAHGNDATRAELLCFIISLAEDFPTGCVRVDLCARLYAGLSYIPSGAEEFVRRRLFGLRRETAMNLMVVPAAECRALEALVERHHHQRGM